MTNNGDRGHDDGRKRPPRWGAGRLAASFASR